MTPKFWQSWTKYGQLMKSISIWLEFTILQQQVLFVDLISVQKTPENSFLEYFICFTLIRLGCLFIFGDLVNEIQT